MIFLFVPDLEEWLAVLELEVVVLREPKKPLV